jgi:hypothetical protein
MVIFRAGNGGSAVLVTPSDLLTAIGKPADQARRLRDLVTPVWFS